MATSTGGGTNLGHARAFNRRVVLETIRLHGPLSRADITRRTGLSVQTISNIAEELAAAGMLREEGRRQGGRGAPALDLALNPEGGFTFGLSIDHRRLVVVLVDLSGRQRHQSTIAIDGLKPDAVLPVIARTVRAMAAKEGAARERIWGAGVAMPMVFEDGAPVAFGPSSMPAWQDFPITARLAESLDMPVLVENDATAAAVGEQLYGVGRRLRDFFYIYVGVGVGGGMILSGHPYRGSAGRAGELGHVVVDPGGRACACGNRGCLERYASLSAAQAALGGLAEGEAQVDVQALASSAPALGDWMDLAARHLRTASVIVSNLLDPQAIVIGGIIPEPLLAGLMRRLAADGIPAGPRRIPILQAEVDLETPALGGAALPLFAGLAPALSLMSKPTNETGLAGRPPPA
ncbi:ROK family transcriptional regulator [Phreatobacter stygius]|uniref:ROK family transcriptional regulator n=1 Tax=Phreatobacter stygius TaxID=1940610 RepID=A0A4D7AZP2_9HYPH|nr:ROK family transcriptional regulator [Phreatobacter stygius]QCI66819.1 ROK family transcriptional regulator [Phreatobacter stygius]